MGSAYQNYMKRELKGKMKGKTAAQRKAIFRAAAAGWKKQSKPSRVARAVNRVRTARTRIQSSRNSGGNHMAKGGFNTSKLFKLARIASLVAPGAIVALDQSLSGTSKAYKLTSMYTGYNPYDGSFKIDRLAQGYLPFVATSLITAAIPRLNHFVRGLL